MNRQAEALKDAIRDVMGAHMLMSEVDALEAALEVAEEWQMRLREIRAAEDDNPDWP